MILCSSVETTPYDRNALTFITHLTQVSTKMLLQLKGLLVLEPSKQYCPVALLLPVPLTACPPSASLLNDLLVNAAARGFHTRHCSPRSVQLLTAKDLLDHFPMGGADFRSDFMKSLLSQMGTPASRPPVSILSSLCSTRHVEGT